MENAREEREAPQGAGGPPPGFEPPKAPGPSAAPGAGATPPPGPGQEWPTLGRKAAYEDDERDARDDAPRTGYAGPGGGYRAAPGHSQVPAGNHPKRLYRSETDRLLAGVCGGLSDYLGVDANLLRVVFVLLAIFAGGSGLLIYVIGWAMVPRESRLGISPSESAMDAVNEVRERFQGFRKV